jgi:cytochrome c2
MKRIALLLLPFLLACRREPAALEPARPQTPAGNTERGKQLTTRYGCTVCHVTPGISGPHGMLGPSLAGVASRPLLSNGTYRNTPENLAKFIESPASMNPASSMPPLGVAPADAQDIAAYLTTLR